jgi:uroporphyrinogen decarboxylase
MIKVPWKPDPDYHRVLNTLQRQGDPNRVTWLELFADPEIMAAILEEAPLPTKDRIKDRDTFNKWLDQRIRFWYQLGYDAFWHGPSLNWLGIRPLEADDSAGFSRGKRSWVTETAGLITNWEEFDRYPWPRIENVDFYPLEYVCQRLPQGMAVIGQCSGILEPAMWLMGYETFAMALYEQPDLIEAVFSKIKEICVPLAQALVEVDRVAALWIGDDMGFKTSTMISPQHLRQYVFPIQKQLSEAAHAKGMPFLLHSCGKLDRIMQSLIEDVRIDAKHSFEDAIEPVEQFSDRYGKQIAVIGGVDMDLLARGTEAQVRARTKQILESCFPGRGYLLGSGNSVANFLLPGNFLAMLDEGYKFNLEHSSS